MNDFSYPIRVYYEDTDAAGVVYYANYLKFAERARTEWLRAHGFDQSRLWEQKAIGFVVRACKISYIRPGKLDDLITVKTSLREAGKARMKLTQQCFRGEELLVEMEVEIACVDKNFRATRIPTEMIDKLMGRETRRRRLNDSDK